MLAFLHWVTLTFGHQNLHLNRADTSHLLGPELLADICEALRKVDTPSIFECIGWLVSKIMQLLRG